MFMKEQLLIRKKKRKKNLMNKNVFRFFKIMNLIL